MEPLLRFPTAAAHDAGIGTWMQLHGGELGIGDAAFADVNAFTAHVNVGFFKNAAQPEPADADALRASITAAYADMQSRLG